MADTKAGGHALESFLRGHRPAPDAGHEMVIMVRPFLGYVNLRGNGQDPDFTMAVGNVLGQELPTQANTLSRAAHSVFWLGPDEWLMETGDGAALTRELERGLSPQRHAVTDQTGAFIRLCLKGARVRELLAAGCSLDLHDSRFPAGHCAQTGMAATPVLISRPAEETAFDIIVRRSFAEYLALWLDRAGREFGAGFRSPD